MKSEDPVLVNLFTKLKKIISWLKKYYITLIRINIILYYMLLKLFKFILLNKLETHSYSIGLLINFLN